MKYRTQGSCSRFRRFSFSFTAALGLIALHPPQAQAVSLSVVGALTSGTTNFTDAAGDTTQGKLGYGAGVLLDGRLTRGLGLETGAIYLVNHFDLTTAGTTTSTSLNSIYVPIDLRLHLGGPLSLMGGGYYNDFTQSGAAADDGWEAGVRFSSRRWFIDGRYSHGLKDQGGFEYTNLLGLLGIRL